MIQNNNKLNINCITCSGGGIRAYYGLYSIIYTLIYLDKFNNITDI